MQTLRGRENDAGYALEAMKPLQEATAAGIGVVIVQHERKGGGEVGESGRGSTAFAGAVDIVLSIGRPTGSATPNVRQIRSLSRFPETPESIFVELTEDGYVDRGDKRAFAADQAETLIVSIAPDAPHTAIGLTQLAAAAGLKRSMAQRAVKALTKSKLLLRCGAGARGDPFRYYKQTAKATGLRTQK